MPVRAVEIRERWKNVSEVWRLKESSEGFESTGEENLRAKMYGNWVRGEF